MIMGLFTGAALTAHRPARQLKRRSLGGKRAGSSTSSPSSAAEPSEPSPNGHTPTVPTIHPQQTSSKRTQKASSDGQTAPVRSDSIGDEEGADLDLAELRSDDAFLYERSAPVDVALGLDSSPPQPSLLERIEVYVAEHYLDCFGITHRDELVRHHNRLIPFFAKAPRFVSIHSLKQKELERDYTEVHDTADTCARRQLCQGRCLLGFACPPDQ